MSGQDAVLALREVLALSEKANANEGRPWEWSDRTVDSEGYAYIPECSYFGPTAIALAQTYENCVEDCDFIAAAVNFIRTHGPALAATPASDEAVGDAMPTIPRLPPPLLVHGAGEMYDRIQMQQFYVRGYMDAERALSARTAAPAEQPAGEVKGGDALTLRAVLVYPGSRISDVVIGGHKVQVPNEALQAARLAPIAPDARSVDGLSGEEREALYTLEQVAGECFAFGVGNVTIVCAALRRLAGAKVQSVVEGPGHG